VVDEQMAPLPAGQTGELLIGGDGVALGYCDEERTLQSFAPAAGVTGAAGLLYRTGDMVRDRGDGVLEFFGRRDEQVKVRGHRIEPGEVEAALLCDKRVARCAVRASGEGASRQLLATVVLRVGATASDVPDILARQRAFRPAHLVPDRVTVVDDLPLLSTGKVDRTASVPG
jgi:acyl-coenzyme A synthetase/AMP-(fatty) acid ligase